MLNLAINLFLFIAILFMIGIIFFFVWLIVTLIFAANEIKKGHEIIMRSDNDGT